MALLDAPGGTAAAAELARALGERGHRIGLLRPRGRPALEALLRRRGFVPGLTGVPEILPALARGNWDVVHVFPPVAAAAALRWRGARRRPLVVVTALEVLGRATVADRRLRLASLASGYEGADATLAADEEVREALRRWLALEAPVTAPADAAAHEQLYLELLAGA